MTTSNSEELNISLEHHLVDTLRPLRPLLPSDLAEKLSPYLSASPPKTIPYTVLFAISRWTRSEAGLDVLHAQTPPLNLRSYSMVSLLAGGTTSPDRFFGKHTPPRDPAEIQADRYRERKAITALVNCLLSIAGSAVAVYWVTEKAGWRIEWRVILSLFMAVIIAISEGALFLIWQHSRPTRTSPVPKRRRLYKKEDDLGKQSTAPPEPHDAVLSTGIHVSELRQRK